MGLKVARRQRISFEVPDILEVPVERGLVVAGPEMPRSSHARGPLINALPDLCDE
jgi:hypothetical protein